MKKKVSKAFGLLVAYLIFLVALTPQNKNCKGQREEYVILMRILVHSSYQVIS